MNENKKTSRRALQLWASNQSDQPEDFISDQYVNHQEPDVEGGVSARDLKAWKELVNDYHGSFSNSRVQIIQQIAEGNLVATRWEFTASHTGEYMGLAPTGREITWTGVQIDRYQDGKIVESWVDWDKYRFFEGLGLVK